MELLNKLTTLELEAASFGFKWEKPEQIISQIQSETTEIEVHLQDGDQEKLQEEIGDLLHAIFSLCVFCGFDPVETLALSVTKFEKRFESVKQLALQAGFKNLQNHSFDELMQFWNRAKKLVG